MRGFDPRKLFAAFQGFYHLAAKVLLPDPDTLA